MAYICESAITELPLFAVIAGDAPVFKKAGNGRVPSLSILVKDDVLII